MCEKCNGNNVVEMETQRSSDIGCVEMVCMDCGNVEMEYK